MYLIKPFLFILIFSLIQADILQSQDRPDRQELRDQMHQMRATTIGQHGSYDFDAEHFGIGVHSSIPIPNVPIFRFYPNADLYFGDETFWQVNADATLTLPYIHPGGGLAVVDGDRVDSDETTEIGLTCLSAFIQPD